MTNKFSGVQESFAGALLDADRPVPSTVTSHTSRTPQKRFAVYRNNVVVGLVVALRTQFPATERIVGEEFFAAMARVYIATEPPRSPILVHYGDCFPGFIANFAPTAELPYLADVAQLEVARTRAYHAADADSIDPACWQGLDPTALLGARVTLHPSVQILRSAHPIVTIWSMNSGEGPIGSIEDCEAEDALVVRAGNSVEVRHLPAGGAAFLGALALSATFSDAAQSAAADQAEFDIIANLTGLIKARLVTELHCTPIQKEPTP